MARSKRTFLIVALAMTCAGFAGWIYQLMRGLVITDMSNMFNWGFYIAAFAFLVGVAAGGMIISSCIYLFDVEKLKPFGKIASLSAFACACGAGAMVLVDLGSIQNILNIFIHPNFSSPLVWDVIVISCYIVLTFLSVYFQLLPDCKKDGLWFFNGGIRNQSLEEVEKKSHTWSKRIGLVALPFAIGIHTVTALIFATQNSHEWWHTAILPPDFIAMAVASGGSLVLILAIVLSGRELFNERLGGYRIICRIIAVAIAVHLFFTAMELILAAWAGSVETQTLLGVLFGDYGVLYAIELILPTVAMVTFFSKKWTASKGQMVFGSVIVLIATLVHRLMLLYPAFKNATVSFDVLGANGMADWLYPVSTGRVIEMGFPFASTYAYMPTVAEYLVSLLPFGLVLLILAFMNLKYPLVRR